ncbi:MAG: hypothetical protein GWP15_02215 [Nitrospirae bacterium]|nr:hypothetical protein [Nitrospirota bacterium]
MRVIATQDTYLDFEKTQQDLTEMDEGIVLLAQNSLSSDKNWTIQDLAKLTESLAMTIIGTRINFETHGDNETIYILKNGTATPAQQIFSQREREEEKTTHYAADDLRNVSYQARRQIMALTRVSLTARNEDIPHEGEGMADLLLVPDTHDRIRETNDCINLAAQEILSIHGDSLKEDALIVRSDDKPFIYSVKDGRRVGEKKSTTQGTKYVVHEF